MAINLRRPAETTLPVIAPTGGAGAVPPAHAPIEQAVPLAPSTIATHRAAAAVNEKSLAPLRAPRGAPLAGAALIAAVGVERARLIEASRQGAVTVPDPKPPVPPVPPPVIHRGSDVGIPRVHNRAVQRARPSAERPALDPTPAVAAATTPQGARASEPMADEVETTLTPEQEAEIRAELIGDTDAVMQSALQTASASSDVVRSALHDNDRGSVDAGVDLDPVIDILDPIDLAGDNDQPPLAPIEPHMRAASNTDSPSRGMPTAITDPGKKITGGFGDAGEAMYYPLDGSELRAVINGLMDQIRTRLMDDLRFSLALTYPRVRARVEVIVEAYAQETQIIPAVAVPAALGQPGSTPLDIARHYGDEVVFVVVGSRQEFDGAGDADTAPNAMRLEVGLQVPAKRRVDTPDGRGAIVDLVQS